MVSLNIHNSMLEIRVLTSAIGIGNRIFEFTSKKNIRWMRKFWHFEVYSSGSYLHWRWTYGGGEILINVVQRRIL
jgi:hypothetical protein